MREINHSVVREGFIAGVIGAAIVAVWYFVVDLAAGAPLRTPQMIGQLLLHGNGGFDRAVSPAAVLVATLFHGAAFVLIGIALTAVVHLAVREIAWRMGLLIGLVIAAATAVAIASGHLLWAFFGVVLTGLPDLLDGSVARYSGKAQAVERDLL